MTILAKRKQKSLTLSCLSVICVEKIIFSRKRILGKILLQLPQRLASEDLWSGYGDCPSDGVYGVVVCIACKGGGLGLRYCQDYYNGAQRCIANGAAGHMTLMVSR